MNKEQEEILRAVKLQNMKQKPELSAKTAHSFNFAACFLPVIYNVVYGRIKLAFAFIALTVFPHLIEGFASDTTYAFFVCLNAILSIFLAIYSGFSANKIVYKARNYDDEVDFIKSQNFWLPAAGAAVLIHFLLLPIQYTGHFNTIQMIKFAEAKEVLKQAIQKGKNDGNLLGVNTLDKKIPAYFAKYLGKGRYDGKNTIYMPNGVQYIIKGRMYECGSVQFNTYHGRKTACAVVRIDVNGDELPNEKANVDLKSLRDIFNRTKIQDRFTMYAYNNDLAPKAESLEQYILRKFER